MFATMPIMNSFLRISAAGFPIFSEKSRTVIVSVVITAFSITTGSVCDIEFVLRLSFCRRRIRRHPPSFRGGSGFLHDRLFVLCLLSVSKVRT